MRVGSGLVRAVTHRTARLVVCAVATAGVVASAGCTSTVAGTGTLGPGAVPKGTDASGQPTPSDTPSSSVTPPATSTPGPTSFHKVRFELPTGWRFVAEAGSACLDPTDAPTGTCTVRIVDLDATAAQHSPVTPPDPQGQQGWWLGTGPPMCDAGRTVPVTASTLVDTSFVRMRNKTAAYSTWRVTCSNAARNFSPRLWWLPVTMVAFEQHRGGVGAVDAQVDQIMASVTVTS